MLYVLGKESKVYSALKTSSQSANFSVYRRSEIPQHWHYSGSGRAPPILAVADPGYAFNDLIEWYQDVVVKKTNVQCKRQSLFQLWRFLCNSRPPGSISHRVSYLHWNYLYFYNCSDFNNYTWAAWV